MPLVSDLDPSAPNALAPPDEIEAWGSFNLLRQPVPQDVDPAVAEQTRAAARDTLTAYQQATTAAGTRPFPTMGNRATAQREQKLRDLFTQPFEDTLDPERYAALQQRAATAPDPEAYQQRQALKTYLRAQMGGKPLPPANYPLARKALARQLGVEDDDRAVFGAIRQRYTDHRRASDVVSSFGTEIVSEILAGQDSMATQLQQSALEKIPEHLRGDASEELRRAAQEARELRRQAAPHARRLTRFLGALAGREQEAQQATLGDDAALDFGNLEQAVDELQQLPPELRAAAIAQATATAERLYSGEGHRTTARENAAAATGSLVRDAIQFLRGAYEQNIRPRLWDGLPGDAADAARQTATQQAATDDERFRTRAAILQGTAAIPTYKPSDNFATKAVLSVGRQAPSFAAVFNPASFGALGLSMAGQSLQGQRLASPEANASDQVTGAAVSGAAQLGVEFAMTRAGLRMLKGRAPTIAGILSKSGIQNKYLRGTLGGALVTAGAAGTEYSEEVIQDGIDRLTSDLVRELNGLDASTDWGQFLADWNPASGTRQAEETLYAVVPFALIGGGIVGSYSHFKYGRWLQQSRPMLKALGVPEPVISEIQEATPEKAAQLTREAFQTGLAEISAEQKQAALDVFRESAAVWARAGMPVVYQDTNDEGADVWVFEADPTASRSTRRLFDTEAEAFAAWQDAMTSIEQDALDAVVQAAQGSALEQVFGEGSALEQKGQAVPIDGPAPRISEADQVDDAFGKPLATPEQIAARVQQFLLQGGNAKDVENLVIKARRHAERLRDGSTRQILQYFTDSDPIAILEDGAEAFLDQSIADGFLEAPQVVAWIRATERATGSTYLEEGYDPTAGVTLPLAEAFSAIVRDYAFAQVRADLMPEQFRDWVSMSAVTMGSQFAYTEELRRSPKLAQAIAEGRIDSTFEANLADALGLNRAEIDRRLEQRYREQVAAEAMEGMPEIAQAAKGQIPHPQTLRDKGHPLSGEAQRIYDALKRPTRQRTKDGRPVMRTNEANAYFLPYGEMVDLDDVRVRLNEQGFSFDTPADLLTALDESLNYGVRTHATRGMAEDSAPTFSLGRAAITPTAQTRTYPTEQGGVIGPATFAISAYHGTPHKVDRFSTEFMGTGEGAQAYGWGLYFAADEGVAKSYRDALSGKPMVPQRRETLETKLRVLNKRLERARAAGAATSDIEASISEVEEELATTGNLYRVTLNVEDDQLLDWDKPLSEQSAAVRKAWDTLEESPPEGVSGFDWRMAMLDAWFDGPGLHNVGGTAYLALINQFGRKAGERVGGEHARNASAALLAAGIRGIRYLDGNSRGSTTLYVVTDQEDNRVFTSYEEQEAIDYVNDGGPEANLSYTTEDFGNYNYVIFDEADIDILEENGQPVDTDLGTPSFALSPASINRLEAAIAAKMAEGPVERADYYTRLRDRLAGVLIRYKEHALAPGATDAERQLRTAREALEETKAIVAALPPEARGRVNLPVADILDAKTQRGRVTRMIRLIQDADAALETVLKDQYREAIGKLIDLAKPDVNPATRQARGRLTPETQREVAEILAAVQMTPVKAGIAQHNADLELSRKELYLAAQTPGTEAFEQAQADYIAAKVHHYRVNTFGAVTYGSAADLAAAHDALLALYKQGRYARNILEDQRRQEMLARRQDVLASLKPVDQPTHSRKTAPAKLTERLAELARSWRTGHYSFHDIMETLFPMSATAAQDTERARAAETGYKRALIGHREHWEQWARTHLDLPKRGWKLKLDHILARLSERKDTGIEIREGTRFVEESLDEEQALAILEGRMKPGWQDDKMAMLSLRQALADFRLLRDRDKKRVQKVRFQRLKARGKPAFLHLSDLEAAYILQLAAQQEYGPTLDAWGFTDAVLDQLLQKTDERALRIGDYLQERYDAEWARLNPIYRELYGFDMPKIRNYAPGRFEHAQNAGDLDPEAGDPMAVNALSSGFTKNRVNHLARPKQKNALGLYWEHLAGTEYFIHWAKLIREMRATYTSPEIRRAIEGNYGMKAARDFYQWLDVLAADGNIRQAEARAQAEMSAKLQLGLSAVGLAYNLGSVFKQAQAALNGFLEMPVADLFRGASKVIADPSIFAKVWQTDTIQQRVKEGLNPEDRRLVAAANQNPSLILEAYRIGRYPLAAGDAIATTLYAAAAYTVHRDNARAAGMTPAAAEEHALRVMDRIVKKTAQPATTQDRSLNEITAGRMGMIVGYMFRSDPRQKLAIVLRAFDDFKAGRIDKKTLARKILFGWLVYGLMNELLSDLWQAATRDDDDPERWDWRDYLAAMIAGPLSGGGWQGGMLEAGIRGAIGTDFYGGKTQTAQVGDLMLKHGGSRFVSTLLEEADADLGDLIQDFLGDARDYATLLTPISEKFAMPAVGARVLRDTVGIIDRWTVTESERQDAILAEYKATQKAEREAARAERLRTEGPPPVLTPQERALSSLKVEHRAQAIQRIAAPMTEAARRDYLARLQDLGILTKATREAME